MENGQSGFEPDERKQFSGTILLIEDKEMVRLLVETLLVERGFSVLSARDGLEGLYLYKQNEQSVRLVFTELQLPALDGFTAFQKMKQLNPKLKAIFTSRQFDSGMIRKLQQEGVRQFLRKPYHFREVLTAIDAALEEK